MKQTIFWLFLFLTPLAYSQSSKLDSLDIIFNKTTDINKKMNILKEIVLEAYLKDYDKIKSVHEIASEISNEKEHHEDLLLIRRIWGVSLMNNGKFEDAKKQFRKNIKTLDRAKEANQAYVDYMNLSNVFRYQVELDSCQYFIEKAIKIVEQTPMKDKYTSAYNNLAGYYYLRGNTNKAIEFYLKAIDSSKYIKFERKVISTYNNISQLFRESENCEKSIFYANKGLNISNNLNFKQGIADASLHLANCYFTLKKPKDSTKAFFQSSIDIYKELNDNIYLIDAYENYSLFLSENEMKKEAINYKLLALKLAEEQKMKDKIFGVTVSIAKEYFNTNKNTEALKYTNRALIDTLNTNLMNYDNLIDLYYQKSKLEEDIGNINEALFYSNKHSSALKKHFELKNQESITEIETKYQTEKKEKENLQLKADKAEQAELLAKENKRKWLLGAGLLMALLALAVFTFFYKRNKKQKEVIESLQKELHHRIKNNLSIIDTFIELAKEEFEDFKFSSKLTELQNRIDSINEVHQQLYKNNDVTNLNLSKYIETLSNNVISSFPENNITIEKSVEDNLNLNADKSFPVGLIINEFLTNSYKYAFENNIGLIKVSMKAVGNNYELLLSDNGKGLPEDFDIKKSDSFGLRIMKLLSEQLNGSFTINNNNGLTLNIKFPK